MTGSGVGKRVEGNGRSRTRKTLFVFMIAGGFAAIWLGLAYLADSIEVGVFDVTPVGLEVVGDDVIAQTVEVGYVHGEEVRLVLSLANSGWFGVEVTNVSMFPPASELFYSLLIQSAVEVEDLLNQEVSNSQVDDARSLSEGSVSLPAGEERDFAVIGVFADCEWYEQGSGNEFNSLVVRYTHLGIPQSVELATRTIAVESPPECPTR